MLTRLHPRVAHRRLAAVLASAFLLGGCQFLVDRPLAPQPTEPDPLAARLPALESSHFPLSGIDQTVIGEMQALFTRYEDTFSAIAREYNLGFEELRHANPGVNHWLPGHGTPVYLPTRLLLPDAPRNGIVLNVASMRLFYFTESETGGELSVTTHPIGIGREGWATPTGSATVTSKARDPVWYVPASIRKEHAEIGDPLPAAVQPGPDNPLGKFAMALSMPGYLIHGTNKPAGVGMRVSHGCVRLYPNDVERLFERVTIGTPVHIVNQPVLAGWHDGQLFLEIHPPLAEDERDLRLEAERVIAAAMARADAPAASVDRELVRRVVEERRGIPFPVLAFSRAPEQYLARSRIIENTTPPPNPRATAQVD